MNVNSTEDTIAKIIEVMIAKIIEVMIAKIIEVTIATIGECTNVTEKTSRRSYQNYSTFFLERWVADANFTTPKQRVRMGDEIVCQLLQIRPYLKPDHFCSLF